MKFKNCIILFFLNCTLVQASHNNSKESYPSIISPASRVLNDMNGLRLSSQESQEDANLVALLTIARIERKQMLAKCAGKLRAERVDRGTLKYVCSKLPRHLNDSDEDTAIHDKIDAIRDRFYGLTGSSVYNLNPTWWFYSDREIRDEAIELNRLIMKRISTENPVNSMQAQVVQEPSAYEVYDTD